MTLCSVDACIGMMVACAVCPTVVIDIGSFVGWVVGSFLEAIFGRFEGVFDIAGQALELLLKVN